MAIINICEAKGLSKPNDGDYNLVPVLDRKISGNLHLSQSTASVQSGAFNASTKYIRIVADAACYYEIGTNPTAKKTSASATRYLPAGVFVVEPVDGGDKLAVITA